MLLRIKKDIIKYNMFPPKTSNIYDDFINDKVKPNTGKSENSNNETSSWWNYFGFKNEKTLQETYKHKLYETAQYYSTKILPKLNSDHISGKLTPEEFVAAGDYLISNNKTWHWASSPSNLDSNMPPKKQYLLCNSVVYHKDNLLEEDIRMPHCNDLDAWACHSPHKSTVASDENSPHIYDISLTYDASTGTPRIWLLGYSEDSNPLNMDEITQDIHVDYVGDTVTMIPHPFTNLLNVSIHPCRHADGMKKLIENINVHQEELFAIEEYLILFLKLITNIINLQ